MLKNLEKYRQAGIRLIASADHKLVSIGMRIMAECSDIELRASIYNQFVNGVIALATLYFTTKQSPGAEIPTKALACQAFFLAPSSYYSPLSVKSFPVK